MHKPGSHPLTLLTVLLSSFLLALTTGAIFLKINQTEAINVSDSTEVDIGIELNPIIDISTNAPGGVLMIPLSSYGTGFKGTKDLEVYVNTNNITGYTLTMNSLTNNTALVHQLDSTYEVISSSHPYLTPATLTADSWGHSVWTTGQTTSSTTFSTIPPSTAPREIAKTTTPASNHTTTLTFGADASNNKPSGIYLNTMVFTATTNYVPPPPEKFSFTIDTRMTDTLDTDPTHFSGTATSYSIPTCDTRAYNWIIDWGDGTPKQTVAGTGASNCAGILHNYATSGGAGEYQITIHSNGGAIDGWMHALNFGGSMGAASTQANKNMVKSIDTPIPANAYIKNINNRFSTLFSSLYNAVSIPDNLFSKIDTSGDTNFFRMFQMTFAGFATNSTSATIPSNLFSTINTSSGTNLSAMFSHTFAYSFDNSTAATIPTNLFSSINTSMSPNLSGMFYGTFYEAFNNSTIATIPSGLFSTINTSASLDLSSMFMETFANCTENSTIATVPPGLFSSINTSSASNLSNMFKLTFMGYARYSTSATIPTGLFSSVNTSAATNLSGMFSSTFRMFAYANKANDVTPDTDINDIWGSANLSGITAANAGGASGAFYWTFSMMPSLVGQAQTFINNKLSGIIPTSPAGTFTNSSVSDLTSLHPNWQ